MFKPESPEANKQDSSTEMLPNDLEQQAKEIAQSGDYDTIKQALEEKELLESQIERVREEYKPYLESIDFLTELDLEMLTILELYDKNLAFHSLETYALAKDKSERPLAFNVVLIDVFASENVAPEQFFRACLLHDVGKVYVPNFILNDETSFEEMSELMDKLLNQKDEALLNNIARVTNETIADKSVEELHELVNKSSKRPVHVVPVKYLLNEKQTEITENLYKINIDLSLMDVIQTHENHSGEVLRRAGYEVESDLAGAHHNYHGRGSSHQRTLEALRLSVDTVEFLRMADITHALGDSRPYNKTGFSKPKIWKAILEEMKAGKIRPIMTYIWLDDEIKLFEKNEDENNQTIEDRKNIQLVKNELSQIYSNLTTEDEFQFPKAA